MVNFEATMSLLQRIRDEARKNPWRIALPEADEPRTLKAAVIATRERLARGSLVTSDPARVRASRQRSDSGSMSTATVPSL